MGIRDSEGSICIPIIGRLIDGGGEATRAIHRRGSRADEGTSVPIWVRRNGVRGMGRRVVASAKWPDKREVAAMVSLK